MPATAPHRLARGQNTPSTSAGKNADAKTYLEKYLAIDPNGKDAATAKEMLKYVK